MTLPTYTAAEIAAMTLSEAIEKHRVDHNIIHNLSKDAGSRYVRTDGDD